MELITQLQALLALIAQIQAQNVDLAAQLEASAKASYDKGFADGVASVPPPVSDKIYSQAELDAKLAEAVAPLQAQIADLQAQVDAIPAKIAEAVAALKADLAAKYQELLVVEQNAETGFAELLK